MGTERSVARADRFTDTGSGRPASSHASYRQELRLAHYVGGPFEDRTGGLITFDADDTALVQRAVYGDPFILEGLVDAHWLKKWTPESKHPDSHGEVDRRQPTET
jgi:hypothetical protein